MSQITPSLPRVEIQFCTQCKWMLRAAYFAQELLSTFSTDLGEVALQPSTGGTFVINLYHAHTTEEGELAASQKYLLWDRKAEGGFPETKEIKRRVRDIIDPARNLGHVDGHKKSKPTTTSQDLNISTLPPTAPNHPQLANLNDTSEPTTPLPLPSPLSPLEVSKHHSNKPLLSDLPPSALPVTASLRELKVGGLGHGKDLEGREVERKFTPMDVDVLSRRTSTKMSGMSESEGSAEEKVECKDCE